MNDYTAFRRFPSIVTMLEQLPADLLGNVLAIWNSPQTPVQQLIFMARLARHDDRIAAIVQALIPARLVSFQDRMAVERELACARQLVPQVVAGVPSTAPTALPGGGAVPPRSLPVPPVPGGPLHPKRPAPGEPGPGESEDDPHADEIRIDPEIARICIHRDVRRDSELRLWAVLKRWGAARGGFMDVDRLYELIGQHVTDYTRRHFRRLLAAGNGLFWKLDGRGRVFLIGSVELSRRLVRLAGPGVVGTNRPGARDMWIPIGENIQQFRAHCLAAWYEHRNGPTISRATLESLWGRSDDTLRAWERLLPRLRVMSNYGQVVVTQDTPIDPGALPNAIDNPSVRTFPTWQGDPLRTCQLPNTYVSFGYRQAPHKGRGCKRRRASFPVSHGAGQTKPARLYWTDPKRLERRNRRSDQPTPGWLFIGETRHARRVWELTTGQPETRPDCIARGERARRIWSEWSFRVRTFSRPSIMVNKMTTRRGGAPDQSSGGGVGRGAGRGLSTGGQIPPKMAGLAGRMA